MKTTSGFRFLLRRRLRGTKQVTIAFQGAADRTRLSNLGIQIVAGFAEVQMAAVDVAIYQTGADLPAQASLLSVTGQVVVTSTRQVDGAIELRLFNPATKPATAGIELKGHLGKQPTQMERVDFESRVRGPAETFSERCEITVRPKEILTLRFT